jgi:hypothetical protein
VLCCFLSVLLSEYLFYLSIKRRVLFCNIGSGTCIYIQYTKIIFVNCCFLSGLRTGALNNFTFVSIGLKGKSPKGIVITMRLYRERGIASQTMQ